MKKLVSTIVATLLTLTALAEDVRTFEEMNDEGRPLPPADYTVTIENNEATICDSAMEVLGVAKSKQKIPIDLNGLRSFTLGLMTHVMADDGIYLIIGDEFEAWYYKADIKRVSPDEITPVHTPNPKGI